MYKYRILLCLCICLCGVLCALNQEEGSKCTWNNVTGQCVSIYRCLSTFLDIKMKEYAPICTFKGKNPIVCCTDCVLVNDTRQMIMDWKMGLLIKTGSKARDKCVDFIHTLKYPCKKDTSADMFRVFNADKQCNDITVVRLPPYFAAAGGQLAKRDEFPHMALLGYGDSEKSASWLCGGSVISERFILTAGHCLSSPSIGEVKFVAVGILKRTDPNELWQIHSVKRAIPHPDYQPPSKYNDIALLETMTTITFGDNVMPACLHTEMEPKETASATGWGALGHRRALADNLQAVYVSRFNEEECSKSYPRHRHLLNGYNHASQMCYGDKLEPKDTCEGDSGGPLQTTEYNNTDCIFVVLGVTSYGRECGISGGSGVYTRVYYYVPWIESIVWP